MERSVCYGSKMPRMKTAIKNLQKKNFSPKTAALSKKILK